MGELEDREAIRDRMTTYGRAMDDGRADAFADCWTQDAVVELVAAPHRELAFPEGRFEGREAIMGWFAGHTHAPDRFHQHRVHGPLIAVDGDRATVESDFERVDESPDGPLALSFGRYRDELVRCADGAWRFTVRRAEIRSVISAPPTPR